MARRKLASPRRFQYNVGMNPLETYLRELREIRSTGAAVAETSFYPVLSNLLNEIGKTLKPRVRCVINIANRGAGLPDGGLFTPDQFQKATDTAPKAGQLPGRGVLEVKSPADDVRKIARSEQVKRYVTEYGLVLVTNYRDFLLLGRDAQGNGLPMEGFTLAETEAAFWQAAAHPQKAAKEQGERFCEYVKRVMLSVAPLSAPQDVAWFLASYARDAKARVENHKDLSALAAVRTALEEALGMKFTGDKGEHFFRSTLVQTIFYGVFSAWVLWHRERGMGVSPMRGEGVLRGEGILPSRAAGVSPAESSGNDKIAGKMPAPRAGVSPAESLNKEEMQGQDGPATHGQAQRAPGGDAHATERFDWRISAWSLRVPFISALYNQIATPSQLGPLGLVEVLDWTAGALNRVNRAAFFQIFQYEHAVQYFYEPFLEAFDPELRKEMGVWLTPHEIVRYQVARVHTVLREELGIADGLADPNVVVLDPCCGTAAYLVEVLKRMRQSYEELGYGALVGFEVLQAASERVFGFETRPIPFIIAQIQIYQFVQGCGLPFDSASGRRPAIFLTNEQHLHRIPDNPDRFYIAKLERENPWERDRVLVVLGNPLCGWPAVESELLLTRPLPGKIADVLESVAGRMQVR